MAAGGGKPGRMEAEALAAAAQPVWSSFVTYRYSGKNAVHIDDDISFSTPAKVEFQCIVGYSIQDGACLNVIFFTFDPTQEHGVHPGEWMRKAAKAEFASAFEGWEPEVQAMLDCVDGAMRWAVHTDLGTAEPSFTANLLDARRNITPDEEFNLKWLAASLYSSTRRYRLPTMADRSSLPYVNALALEVLRSHAVVPNGASPRVIEDDVYEGHFIPKGSLVMPILWSMLHDERTYRRPMKFWPERFLATEGRPPEKDPKTICFGFGRRICPGRELADISLFTCASTLFVFEISKYKEGGVEVAPIEGQTSGSIRYGLT
ncbi:cytochrome P450 [Schizophyllum commune]